MAAIDQLSSCLPDIVVACIQAAASSGKKLSWTLKEDTRGVLVHLVWKHSKNGSESVCTKWKPRKISPSRQNRNRMRLLKFLSSKQESLSGQLSDARTQVSAPASTEPMDAVDIFLLHLATLLLEVPGVMFPLPLNQWELQTLILLLVISLLFFTIS